MVWVVKGVEYLTHVTLLLYELHWLSICFGVQFTVLAIFKILHGLWLGYLRQGSPTYGLRPTTGLWPVGHQAA